MHVKCGGEEVLGASTWSQGDVQGVALRGGTQLNSQRAGCVSWGRPSTLCSSGEAGLCGTQGWARGVRLNSLQDLDSWLDGKGEYVSGVWECKTCSVEPLGMSGGVLMCLEVGRESGRGGVRQNPPSLAWLGWQTAQHGLESRRRV